MSARNDDQRAFWTENAGPTWVAQMGAMDRLLDPVLQGVLTRADVSEGERVFDIGCGAGTSTLAAGALVGAAGQVTGLDISATLLAVAQDRAQRNDQVDFVEADAQTHGFEPGTTDLMISRFGVMFFDDFNAAFANMARALRPGGRMVFATWGPIPDNPYFTLPARVAKEVFGPRPKTDPDAPGPFALRDVDLVNRILKAAGLDDIRTDTVEMLLPPIGDAAALADLMCQIGPAQSACAHFDAPPAQRAALHAALVTALGAHETAQGIEIPASINFFAAVKPA